MIPYGRQDISEEDIQSVVDVLRSDFLTQGPVVPKFEKTVAEYCGANYAVAVNSATSALHIACLSLGVGPGDYVWTSPITFVASANCAVYCGAKVDFIDIDQRTYNISADCLEDKLKLAEKSGCLPKVVIPVHLSGQSCDMARIYALGQKYNFSIIEDASHAIGGRYRKEPIGNGRYCDITVFSFHPVKIITTGEGGMALTNNISLAKNMSLLRTHGVTREQADMTIEPEGPWYYQQIMLGYNYRMTDMQAALGLSQLQRLDEFVAKRHQIAQRYDEMLRDLPVVTPHQDPDNYSALHLYPILLELDKINKTHKQVFSGLRENSIGVNVHYIPVHTQPYYQDMGFQLGDFPVSENYYSRTISLPMFTTLTDEQQESVVKVLSEQIL